MESYIDEQMEVNVMPALQGFIRIENQSSSFEEKEKNIKEQHQAIDYCVNWLQKQSLKNLSYKVLSEQDKTPCLYIRI